MHIVLSDELAILLGIKRCTALKEGTAWLSIGVREILYIYDNGSKIDVIKDGTIKEVV